MKNQYNPRAVKRQTGLKQSLETGLCMFITVFGLFMMGWAVLYVLYLLFLWFS